MGEKGERRETRREDMRKTGEERRDEKEERK